MAPETKESPEEEDPYLHLEDVLSESSLKFANEANAHCLSTLGSPEESQSYKRILEVLESQDRIPHVTKLGVNEEEEMSLYNFWKDASNPKGIWRKTTLSSYQTDAPEWKTVLDIDELGKKEGISWVWKGYRALPRRRDPVLSSKHVTRVLIMLSNGGSDAITVREFDLQSEKFVDEKEAFNIDFEAKTRISYKTRDIAYVGTDLGEKDDLTDSGYPRTVRQWVRETPLKDAKIVFEGDKTDVSVGAYIDDQRHHHGPIYEVRYRSLTFYTSMHYVKCIKSLDSLSSPEEKDEFVKLDVPLDAGVDFLGGTMLITLRSDWELSPEKTYTKGSLLALPYDQFIEQGIESCPVQVLFQPTERTALETYSVSKNYLILSVMDNVQSKLVFFQLPETEEDNTLIPLESTPTSSNYHLFQPQIRSVYCSPIDSTENDLLWFTTSSYTQPSTLQLADVSHLLEEDKPFITQELKSLPHQYNATDLHVEQCFAESEDGTSIPYFIIYNPKKVQEGRPIPTLLYGYGGFEISMTPRYIATTGISWLERGGAYVDANIRGGGEFGPSWHQAALKEKRNKSYEDFVAVAKHLQSVKKICTPSTLAISGGSNGGLLVGNMYATYPQYFGAIHCAVPLLDMKRYHKLLAGSSWMAEYGNPDIPSEWEFLKQYSPYHNLSSEQEYPPILFTTSTRDDRVHPGHARKMVQKLWDMLGQDDGDVYYYENVEGGHGGAADSKQSAFMTALARDFLWKKTSSSL